MNVNILCLAIFPLQAERIWVDYIALLGFHATIGNDYVCFLLPGKRKVAKDR